MKAGTQVRSALVVLGAGLVMVGCGTKNDATADRAKDTAAVSKTTTTSGDDHAHAPGTPAHPHDSAAPAASDVKTYSFHGTPTKIDEAGGMITIDHEKIGDFMEAMEMPFKVADPAIFKQVKVGKNTHFTLRVAGTEMLITKVEDEHAAGTEH